MDLNFCWVLGVSVSWLGFVPSNFPLTSTSAIYSIDGQPPSNFFVPALSAANALPLYDQIFFKAATLSPGQHELIVTYQGNSGTAPLALDAFIVQNATSSSTTSSLPSSTSATSSGVPSGSSSDSTSKPPLVGIIVGVVGGVVVLVLLLLLYIRTRRRRNHRRARELSLEIESVEEISNLEPFTALEPFTSSPQNHTSEVRSHTPQPLPSKFSRSREPADAAPPVIGVRTNPIDSMIPNSETMPLMQPSTSTQDGNLGFLQHADSGIRMPHNVQGNLVELPPVYTSG